MKEIQAEIKFTKKEVSKMESEFQEEFVLYGRVAKVAKKLDDIGEPIYTIYYKRHGFNLWAVSHDLAQAKRKFIESTYYEQIEEWVA